MSGETKVYTMRQDWMLLGLQDLIKKELSEGNIMVEIGCYAGESTKMFADNCKKVYAIDPWDLLADSNRLVEGHIDKTTTFDFDMRLAEKMFDDVAKTKNNIVKLKDFDYNIKGDFIPDKIDFIYIDSIHTAKELARTIKQWIGTIKPEGKIGGHDYSKEFPGVKKVVDKLFNHVRLYSDSSWVVNVKDLI